MIIRHNTQLNSYNYAVLMMVQGLLRNTDIKTTLSAALIHCIKTVIEDKDILASSPTFRYQDNSEPVHKIHNTKLDESLFTALFNVKLLLYANDLHFTKNDIIQASIYYTFKKMSQGTIARFYDNMDPATVGAGFDITDL